MLVLVLIADIVESRSIPNRAEYQEKLRVFLESVNDQSRHSLLSPYTITVGDEFQAVYRDARSLFTDIMRIVGHSFPHRIRFALSHGTITTELNRQAALGMDGPVFSSARALLNELKKEDRTIVRFILPDNDLVDLINVCLTLFANDLERWNKNAVSIFTLLLLGLTPRQISRETGVHFTTVYRHIRAKHLEDHKKMLELLSKELEKEINVQAAR
jgi:hypothetical protein